MLVVDALNQALIPFLPGEDLETWYRHLYHHIRKIKNIGKMLKMNVTFVLDGCLASEETKQKWFDRREKEARSGRRNVPYAVDTFLEEIIMDQKLNLIVDEKHNADDVIATLARDHNGIILSRDADFYRYSDGILNSRVYHIKNYKLFPTPNSKDERTSLSFLENYKPQYFVRYPKFQNKYVRGISCAHAEKNGKGSFHIALRRFRQGLYKKKIVEIFPVWKGEELIWLNEEINPLPFPKEYPKIETIMSCVGGMFDKRHYDTCRVLIAEIISEYEKIPISNVLKLNDPVIRLTLTCKVNYVPNHFCI